MCARDFVELIEKTSKERRRSQNVRMKMILPVKPLSFQGANQVLAGDPSGYFSTRSPSR